MVSLLRLHDTACRASTIEGEGEWCGVRCTVQELFEEVVHVRRVKLERDGGAIGRSLQALEQVDYHLRFQASSRPTVGYQLP